MGNFFLRQTKEKATLIASVNFSRESNFADFAIFFRKQEIGHL